MATRIRTLNFLPEIFKTVTNSQFLQATLDQVVAQPNTKRIEGYVGSKFGYGINAKNYYVTEPTKTRTDYQLDPGVVFTKANQTTANDFISYPGIIDGLKVEGGLTTDNNRLFNSQFYSWDSFTDLDKIINFNQYYWLPQGPERVTISTETIFSGSSYLVTDAVNGYNIAVDGQAGSTNPTLTLLRGGTYTFTVNQISQFWIQGAPGVTGYSPTQPNLQTRDVLGVINNGASSGVVTFTVPNKNAQDEYNFPGNNEVDVVSTTPYSQINGQLLSQVGNIDGITSLEGLTVMFYNTGAVDPLETSNFYVITYTGSSIDPTLTLVPSGGIPTSEKITARYGTEWISRNFYRNVTGTVSIIPFLSAALDTLYYQDGTTANKVGVIKIVDSNTTNTLNIETEILGRKQYTSSTGVVFTNGLKVVFSGAIYPDSFKNVPFYVEGVGTAIQLVRESDLIAPEPFTFGSYIPYDTTPYDVENYDSTLYVPVTPDYITIARNSMDMNAWSRSNRWFHIDVINATAQYNGNPSIVTKYATAENKAKRPIIEFYPNLRLFDSGVIGKAPVDFVDFRTTDAFTQVAGQENYYPDVTSYTGYNSIIAAVTGATSTTITVNASDVIGPIAVGQYVADSTNVLPTNTTITSITGTDVLTITVSWSGTKNVSGTTTSSIITTDTTTDNYALFNGARIIFAADQDANVRNKIYVSGFSSIDGGTPIITLTEAADGFILNDDQTVAFRGYNNQGKDFRFNDTNWQLTQQKTTVNQPPLFDIFDSNGISLGDKAYYVGTSFVGSTLFGYGIGTGIDDPILGFPIRYSSVDNVGDISFDVTLNSDLFNYVSGTTPITENVNIGYVYNYTARDSFVRQLGWQTAVSPSVQYQIFEFNYNVGTTDATFTCDIPLVSAEYTKWPRIQVFVNNDYQTSSEFTYVAESTSTTVTLNTAPAVDTVIQILLLSDQTSSNAYYQIPINLNNNPLNQEVTTVNVGDIRGQYQSMFFNNPDTVGTVFGSNNFRDLGNLVPYGNRIIQNSASLVAPGAFLRKQDHNLFNSLMYNSKQYINFKTLLVDTVNSTDYSVYMSPAEMLDDAMDQITAAHSDDQPFFWSDMLPSKSAYISNSYSFANSLDVSIYPLSRIYDYTTANYYGVLVYLTRNNKVTQLIRNTDYVVSTDSPSLTVSTDLLPGDLITIKEYNQTYGSYVPNTPTKLGLYPASIPQVIQDINYQQPTYFIVGHDGSYNKLFGQYNTTTNSLVDFRDQVLLEYETRVYNNLKLSNVIPVQEYEVLPGFFRDTDYTYNEILEIYSSSFLNWVGQNRVDYKTQYYQRTNEYTFNYRNSGNKIDKAPIDQGYWRGMYLYFYDTSTPNTSPWEMLGFKNQPSWWTARYGAAPYTSDNLVLWEDLAQGINWNNGDPIVIEQAIRPQLLDILPVDTEGNLVPPLSSIVGNYNDYLFQSDWKVGDVGPTEFSYRRSSSYPFDLMRILALTKPAEFFNLAIDVDNYKYNTEFNQYLVNNRSHLVLSDVQIYGSGTAKTSYINWIVDYEKQVGVDATTNIADLLTNIDVRLVYRVAGFSDKNLLKFYVEKSSANSNNSSLLIPDESYGVLLYDNQPFDRIIYSGVIIQVTKNGYAVYGNSQTEAYFKTLIPKVNGNTDVITIDKETVSIPKDYTDKIALVPYGTEFFSITDVSQFLDGYGKYLEQQGCVFAQVENGIPVTWSQMIAEFLYWVQIGWEVGSIANINPAATELSINKDSYIVQPLTMRQQNFVLNQNLYPIPSENLSVVREGTAFTVVPLSEGDTVAYGQFNVSNFEHGIVFDNVTLFNDTIYNLVTGLRQIRITVRGAKSAEWNGTVDAQGFILNQDNIVEWSTETKYTQGAIVKYKNKYWTATTIIQAKQLFDEREWKETNYNEIQKGLLPNSSTRSYESTIYYDVNKANLENDADQLSFSLIGYRPRDYMALADLTDITQVNVYKNMIREKGTLTAAKAFKGANLVQGGIDYDIYENWAILSGEFGGILNNNFVDIKLNETQLTGNPSTVGLTNGNYDIPGVQQEVPLYSVYNYGRQIKNPEVLATLPPATPNVLFPDAGYVNLNDVKMSAYYYANLPTAKDNSNNVVPLSELYVRDYVWLADYLGTWQTFTPTSLGQVVYAKNNLNGTVTVTFASAHNLSQYQAFAIVNFDARVDNYYIVSSVVDPYKVIITLNLNPQVSTITGYGVGFKFQSQRVNTPSDISTLPLLDSEFIKNKVWVDTNNDGSWAVYRKSLNYGFDYNTTKDGSVSFGSSVAYTNKVGGLIGDAGAGAVYRYSYNPLMKEYELYQTLTKGASFGTTIAYSDNSFIISEPTSGTPKVYVYELEQTTLVDRLNLIQEIPAEDSSTKWGTALSISGDKNWLYISAADLNKVYVYRKSSITGLYELSTSLTVSGLTSGDNFGASITTDYFGDTVVVGAPQQDYSTISNWGYAYMFERTVQNFEAQYTSQIYTPQSFGLSWTPSNTASKTASSITSNAITLNNVTNLVGGANGTAITFTGTVFGGVSLNRVYYVKTVVGSTITLSLTRNGSTLNLTNSSGTMTVNAQTSPLYVSVNGTLLDDSAYAAIGSTLTVYSGLNAGDIINVSGNNFVKSQVLTSPSAPRIGVQFGTSMDSTTYTSEVIIGAPFELSSSNHEGAVYRFTNGGNKYGVIIGTSDCNVTTTRTILLNGYAVSIPTGNASVAAAAINSARITNVQAAAIAGKLIIQLIDINLATPNDKLSITVLDSATPAELGINILTLTQTVECPHADGATQFGYNVRFNESESFVASAPSGTRYSGTTFDFSDDESDNDTVFDNNATQWVDTIANVGAVYMFDYLANYNESLLNPGKFVYAQSTNANTDVNGAQPMYGHAIDFNNSFVMIGTPNFVSGTTKGQVIFYSNPSGVQDWSVYRSSSAVVDTSKIQNVQLYSASTNSTLVNLDYMDPLQGKLLGVVRENIDVVSNIDPASYNTTGTLPSDSIWGAEKVGEIWFDTSRSRFINYHQNDVVYNSKYWGTLFPGSDVAVYSWISSNVVPSAYQGPGTPYDITSYTTEYITNSTGGLSPVYFFWVRNTNIIFTKTGKTLADSIIEQYISNPISSGISYFAPLLPNVFGLYNSGEYVNYTDTVLHIGYGNGSSQDVPHSLYSLIRANYADDFLPGLPASNSANTEPESLYAKLLDSLSGTNIAGSVIPDPYLPKPVQYGVLTRPRQSFFVNRLTALKNYLQYANEVILQYPFIESYNSTFVYKVGEINPSTVNNPNWLGSPLPFFDVNAYWDVVNWWAPGYNDNTKSAVQVSIYADLAALNVPTGTIATVLANGDGFAETYILLSTGEWNRIGLTNGTIQFKSSLWDYQTARFGFGDNFFDTTPYDTYPSEETRYIVRAINEELPNNLDLFRNKALILLFEYIQSETIESQNYLPWLNKTSFVDVAHTIRELKPIEVFQSDNQDFLSGYLNEVKPYHVVIKEFLYKYTGTDVYEGDITDFDLPAKYNSTYEKFITPELVYTNPSADNQYLPSDPIWQTSEYNQWYQNYGVSITGVDNYSITTLASYVALNSTAMAVDNAYGFPINGIITIGEEQIGYANVDRSLNVLSGLTRGLNGTAIVQHLPGEEITINLPAVLLLNGGRAYTEPPKVTAYIDTSIYPEPTRPAVLKAVMNLDSVLSVTVEDPGQGYAVLPKIIIDPATTVTFDSSKVSTTSNTIELFAPTLQTGDLVTYAVGADTTAVGGLENGQRYYINVLETNPAVIIALYSNYANALLDRQRITLFTTGTGANQTLNLGAFASCISSAAPIRENQIKMKFDRTSYQSQVSDWLSGEYYSSFYAGNYDNSSRISSSSISLESSAPPVDNILASAMGAVFEIQNISNSETLSWSSQERSVINTNVTGTNEIKVYPTNWQSLSVADINLLDTTLGFYVGMPVKFIGAVSGGLVGGQTYYVKTVNSKTSFTVSATISNGVPGAVQTLTTSTIGAAGLICYTGELNNVAVVTIDYPGITTATATTQGNNAVTIPLNTSGTGGTRGFYTGLSVYFTGNVFGGIVENEHYYVTSVIDLQNFTISKIEQPTKFTVSETDSSGIVTCNTTVSLAVNDPVIFSNINPATGSTNIVAGTRYYVQSILSGNTIKISAYLNGGVFNPGTCTFASSNEMLATSQRDTVNLTTATGEMTLNVSLPVSPGQVNGQQMTFYGTSGEYVGVTGTSGNYLTRTIDATTNVIAIDSESGGTSGFYLNMPVVFDTAIGGLSAATTYYVTEYTGRVISSTESVPGIQLEITGTTSVGNYLVCADTSGIYVGMPIVFSGISLGTLELDNEYYVHSINSSTQFTVAYTPSSLTPVTVTTTSGSMIAEGSPYITVSATPSGADVSVSYELGPVTMTQTPTDTTTVFDVSYMIGGYSVIIVDGGSGYAVDNTIVILGEYLGGVTGVNDLTMTVNSIDSNGVITNVIRAGTPAGPVNQYYLKVISNNQVEVYENNLLTIPVSGITLAQTYTGVTSTLVTDSNLTTDTLTIADSTGFALYDPIVFTGTVAGGLTLGQTYYIVGITTTVSPEATIQVATSPTGSAINITANDVTCTVAKQGDYAFLPEPFYFNRSVVKYNNRVYQCLISNNDTDFIFGKWELLDSGSSKLNALDRIVGYYQPTINMPGLDLTQLVEGITYPNSTYLGNAFAPDAQFPIDTILQDQPFYPAEVDIKSVIWDGTTYVAAANAPTYSAVLLSASATLWNIDRIANQPINPTDIITVGIGDDTKYIMTTTNASTPLLLSEDGASWVWISSGAEYTPYDAIPFDDIGFDLSALKTDAVSLNSVAYYNGVAVAVGQNIVASTDFFFWPEVYDLSIAYGNLPQVLNGVTSVSIPNYNGFVAVGAGQRVVGSNTIDTNLIVTSTDGLNWVPQFDVLTSYALNAVTSNTDKIIIVGDNSVRFVSVNGSNWNNISAAGTGNPNLNDVIYAQGKFVVVGDNGTIQSSVNGDVWTTYTSGTTENLNSITYNADLGEFVVVGENNITLSSPDLSTWTISTLFVTEPTVYNVQGDAFTAGYGPEEMVPGVVSDTLTMTVATRPGTDWAATKYAHVGYNVVSTELVVENTVQKIFSWANTVETPSQLAVFGISATTGLSVSLYKNTDYTIDWIAQTITMNSTPYSLGYNKIRVDVYETGNGDQLVKANTSTDPIRDNSSTGFSEIYVNCDYSAPIFSGSGVVRPGSEPIEVIATRTEAGPDSITVTNIGKFILNSPIKFYGGVFGGVQEDVTYYVKTISLVTGKITISDTFNVGTGTAGPTFQLSDATGIMTVIIQVGIGQPWSTPITFYNGNQLTFGSALNITRTNSVRDTVTCNSTNGLVVGSQLVFSNTMFGNIIEPMKKYYLKSIYDGNEFTISETLGGATVQLDDATGGAMVVVNDYAFGVVEDSITAKIIFAGVNDPNNPGYVMPYNQSTDYLTYTLFGETVPEQYGYTLPEVNLFTGTGSQTVFAFTNYVGLTNRTSSIVEINGIRQTSSTYTISAGTNTITFTSAPALNAKIVVTTYNRTERQYFNTQYGLTGNIVASIVNVSNALSTPIATSTVTATDGTTEYITCGSTTGFIVGQPIEFKGTSFGSVATDGTVYFVRAIISSTQFTIQDQSGTIINLTTGSGLMVAYVGGQPAVRVTTSAANGFVTGDIVMIDGTQGSVQLNNSVYYVHKITTTQFDLYASAYNSANGATNTPITEISSYISGGYAWKWGTYILAAATATATSSVTNAITCSDATQLIHNTPVIFTKQGYSEGASLFGGLIAGTVYYVNSIVDGTNFTLSTEPDGETLALTTGSGSINVTQWEQNNVDRLWVTINGYRVPSSALRLNPDNYLSILVPISSSDEVIITSMMPSATPNEMVYQLNVSTTGNGEVYRANAENRTWLTQPLYNTQDQIHVNDAKRLVNTYEQTVAIPVGYNPATEPLIIGVPLDKNLIIQVNLFNATTGTEVPSISYRLALVDAAPVVIYTGSGQVGNNLVLTVIYGNMIYLNGEYIRFGKADLTLNVLSELQRGQLGTGEQSSIPKYAEVFGLLSSNRMTDVEYETVWNSTVYNSTLGDPLQISDTSAAIFLNGGSN
jgi:hypothetical protein